MEALIGDIESEISLGLKDCSCMNTAGIKFTLNLTQFFRLTL